MRANHQTLPRDEWNFFPANTQPPHAREWNVWLNYEYARSCRPIVEAVWRIRRNETAERPAYRLAVFLAKSLPEFPSKPWLSLSPPRRGELREHRIIPEIDPFVERVHIHAHDINEFVRDVMEGERIITHSASNERFSVLEINFDSEDSEITQSFARWLGERRESLLKQYNKPVELRSGHTSNQNVVFKPKPFKRPQGQSKNKRQYRNYLNRLAALRFWAYYGDWKKAEYHADLTNGGPLYQGQRSWQRAADEAGDLMMRLVEVWKYAYGFPFILDPKQSCHERMPGDSGSPLPPTNIQMNRARPGIRDFINRQVLSFREISASGK